MCRKLKTNMENKAPKKKVEINALKIFYPKKWACVEYVLLSGGWFPKVIFAAIQPLWGKAYEC